MTVKSDWLSRGPDKHYAATVSDFGGNHNELVCFNFCSFLLAYTIKVDAHFT